MSYGYPDGCSQADHDAYFDTESRADSDPDTILCDCGHYEAASRAEVIGDKVICGKCEVINGNLVHHVPGPVNPDAFRVLRRTLDEMSLKPITTKVRIPERP